MDVALDVPDGEYIIVLRARPGIDQAPIDKLSAAREGDDGADDAMTSTEN